MAVSILDYGMGNLRSVAKAFEHVGAQARIITRPKEVDAADKLVLPGVGAFADAMGTLRARHLEEPIRRHIQRGRPFLGICLGLQLLFDRSAEGGAHQGLGVLGGRCVRFDVDQAQRLKIPHMGWNTLIERSPSPLHRGLPAHPTVYFVHSYHVLPSDPAVVATVTEYGGAFVSSIWRDNVMATQFHPEKSQTTGLTILANFHAL